MRPQFIGHTLCTHDDIAAAGMQESSPALPGSSLCKKLNNPKSPM